MLVTTESYCFLLCILSRSPTRAPLASGAFLMEFFANGLGMSGTLPVWIWPVILSANRIRYISMPERVSGMRQEATGRLKIRDGG